MYYLSCFDVFIINFLIFNFFGKPGSEMYNILCNEYIRLTFFVQVYSEAH